MQTGGLAEFWTGQSQTSLTLRFVELNTLLHFGLFVHVSFHLFLPCCELGFERCYAGIVEDWDTFISKLVEEWCDWGARSSWGLDHWYRRGWHCPNRRVPRNMRRIRNVQVLASDHSTSHTTLMTLTARSSQCERSRAVQHVITIGIGRFIRWRTLWTKRRGR